MKALAAAWGWADGKKTLTGAFLLLLWLAGPRMGIPGDVREVLLWTALPMLGIGLAHKSLKGAADETSGTGNTGGAGAGAGGPGADERQADGREDN